MDGTRPHRYGCRVRERLPWLIDLVTSAQYGISRRNIPARLPIICDADQLGLKQSGDLGGLGVESEATAHA